ncbi:arylsulfatase b [Plakobranchus ocellatus]|uniref:Arylsulfatase b n=1 Tax=Plakobranchus ocellatus TaxID=259542 RepID=A0AAV4DQE1_9GAST|nr:arylsulfatase b [Plakobranchus ocellatus]
MVLCRSQGGIADHCAVNATARDEVHFKREFIIKNPPRADDSARNPQCDRDSPEIVHTELAKESVSTVCNVHTGLAEELVSTVCNVHTGLAEELVSTVCNVHTELAEELVSTVCNVHTGLAEELVSTVCNVHTGLAKESVSTDCNSGNNRIFHGS